VTDPTDFFDLTRFEHRDLWRRGDRVWDALKRLHAYLEALVPPGSVDIQGEVSPGASLHGTGIRIGPGSVVEEGAYIAGPAVIGRDCEIRHGAYVRGGVIAGDGCVIGHATEVKGAILLNGSKAPHFAYVGDSILGQRANLGAGTKLSNLTLVSARRPETGRRPTLRIRIDDRIYDTGLAKLGAILGDDVQTGCNCVTHPGCLVGPRTLVYANLALRKGYTPADSLVKLNQATTVVARRPTD
jgi:NDP-sugar pyrophosphorylase family protein